MGVIAKFRQWTMLVSGVPTKIAVLSSATPDPIGAVAGGYDGEYNNALPYPAGAVVRVSKVQSYGGGVTPAVGVYGALIDVPANGTGNQVPQFPAPASGLQYWYLIAFGPKLTKVCANGAQSIYVNASSTF